jgi:hypothetical protein
MSESGRRAGGTTTTVGSFRALPLRRRHLLDVQRALIVLGVTGLMAGGTLGLAACGGDDRADAGGSGDDGSRSGRGGDDGGEPEATDAATVQPYVEALLVDYDDVVNQIVADPAVAADSDHPLVQEYLDLYEPGSDFARQLVDVWAERGAEGLSTRPFDTEHPASLTRLDGDLEVVSGDEVSFPACIERRLVVVDGEGLTTQRTPFAQQRGEGVAVRVDGEWRLRELAVINGTARCRTGAGAEASGPDATGPDATDGTEGT